jgi:hypothetical protein
MAPVAASPRLTGHDSTVRPTKPRAKSSEPPKPTGSFAESAGQVGPPGRPPPDRQVQTLSSTPAGLWDQSGETRTSNSGSLSPPQSPLAHSLRAPDRSSHPAVLLPIARFRHCPPPLWASGINRERLVPPTLGRGACLPDPPTRTREPIPSAPVGSRLPRRPLSLAGCLPLEAPDFFLASSASVNPPPDRQVQTCRPPHLWASGINRERLIVQISGPGCLPSAVPEFSLASLASRRNPRDLAPRSRPWSG